MFSVKSISMRFMISDFEYYNSINYLYYTLCNVYWVKSLYTNIVEYAQKPKILMNFVDEWFQAKVQTVVFDLRYFSIDCSHHHTIRSKESQQSFLHQNVVVTWLHKTFFPFTPHCDYEFTNKRAKAHERNRHKCPFCTTEIVHSTKNIGPLYQYLNLPTWNFKTLICK